MIAWFRSRKQLHTRNTELEALVAKQTGEIAQLRDENDSVWFDVQRQTAQQVQTLDHTRKLLDAHEAKNAQLIEELRSLRDEIARRERAEAEALTYMPARGFGMTRPIDTPAVQDAMRRRRERQVNAIFGIADDEAAAKRHEDGLGDI